MLANVNTSNEILTLSYHLHYCFAIAPYCLHNYNFLEREILLSIEIFFYTSEQQSERDKYNKEKLKNNNEGVLYHN